MSSGDLFPSADRAPFELPLGREAFAEATRRGLGRAVLHAQEFGVGDRLDLLMTEMLENRSDQPLFDDRADWLRALVEYAPDPRAFFAEFIERCAAQPDGTWDSGTADHHAAVLVPLAKQGYSGARERLRESLCLTEHHDWISPLRSIYEVDGEEGLLFVCRKVWSWIETGIEVKAAGQIFFEYDTWCDENGTADLETEPGVRLVRAAAEAGDAVLAAFLDHLEKSKPGLRITPDGPWTEERIFAWLDEPGEPARRSVNSVARASTKTPKRVLRAIAGRLPSVEEPDRLFRHLVPFTERRLPSGVEHVVGLTRHDDARIRGHAYSVLERLAHPAVRALALASLDRRSMLGGSVGLFKRNFRPGDERVIAAALFVPDDPGDGHGMLMDVIRVVEGSMSPGTEALARFVYEHTTCQMCRADAIGALRRMHAVPCWMAREARHDAEEDVRASRDRSRRTPPK
ncbi:MAG: hypothetical protein IBJ11_07780 [Phycisphaerales bacterium]|nr:hypothetical protein [Phycisphaerales bacterium]